MPLRSHSRITTACNSCRTRKQKRESNRPKCVQCHDHHRNCDWPEQLKRGPAKGYIEGLERRLQETENLLLGLLEQVSDDQLSNSIQHDPPPQRSKQDPDYWKQFPLGSVQDVRSWQGEYQQARRASSNSTLKLVLAGAPAPVVDADATAHDEQTEPQPSVSTWSGAPSVNFQQQFLW